MNKNSYTAVLSLKIQERFVGDFSLMGAYSIPSTSAFDLELNSSFYGNSNSSDSEYVWSRSSGREQGSGEDNLDS